MSQLDPVLRAELAQRNAERATEWYVLVTDDQAEDLAAGFVPHSVKAMVRTMLDWREADRRAALRPVRAAKKKERKHADV